MNRLTLAALLVALFSATVLSAPAVQSAPYKGFRLIQTSEDEPAFWVSPSAAEALGTTHLNYMDITDHQFVDPTLAPKPSAIPANPSHQSVVRPLLGLVDTALYTRQLNTLSSFRNRYYTSTYGVESAEWIFEQASALAANRSDITVTKFSHVWAQPSVIARIEGTAANGELIVIGAHQDSISSGMPSGSAPGADDDGSGSIGILEVLRILSTSNFRPQNPIEIQWYAAEEVGLLGSQAIANNYQSRGVAVRAMMQLDMIGYNRRQSTVAIVTDYVDAETIEFNRKLVDTYLDIGWTNSACGYGCSDHASWNRAGYRSSFPFEASSGNTNPYIHTTSDTMTYVDPEHAKEFIKLAVAFAVELSYV